MELLSVCGCIAEHRTGYHCHFVISNEYSFKTMRQNLIDGLNRNQLFVSKLLLISILISVNTGGLYIRTDCRKGV